MPCGLVGKTAPRRNQPAKPRAKLHIDADAAPPGAAYDHAANLLLLSDTRRPGIAAAKSAERKTRRDQSSREVNGDGERGMDKMARSCFG